MPLILILGMNFNLSYNKKKIDLGQNLSSNVQLDKNNCTFKI